VLKVAGAKLTNNRVSVVLARDLALESIQHNGRPLFSFSVLPKYSGAFLRSDTSENREGIANKACFMLSTLGCTVRNLHRRACAGPTAEG
jgi:hypothetical protein